MTIIGALKVAKAGQPVKKAAPFYSAVDDALANLKRPKGTGIEFLTEVMKTKGVKKAEIADRKLEQAFKAKGKMTKEEAQEVLKENPPPNVQERILEDIDGDERRRLLDDKMEIYGYDNYREVPHRVLREWNAEIDAEAAKYADDDYRTQGGSNYREMLLKLPQSYTEKDFHRLLMLEAEQRRGDLTPAQSKEMAELQAKKQTAASNYQSGHWDDANVLAHMRVQDRLIAQPPQRGFYVVNKTSGRQSAMFDTPEELQAYVETLPESIRNNVTMAQGERKVPPRKVLQVEEIQSDWHQAGRKKGYASEENPMRMTGEAIPLGDNTYGVKWQDGSVDTLGYGKHHAETIAQEGKLTGVVPDAPFKKNWHELAMKRLLNYAAEKGYDGIAITPGAEHFKRYGSERIDWKKGDDGWIVGAKEQTGGRHEGRDLEEIARDRGILLERSGDQVKSKEDLHRIVNTVLNRENNPDQVNKLTNRIWDRMQTEAEGTSLPRKEGMEGFYDKMLTDYLNSYGRDYGAQVQMRQVAATPEAMEKKFNLNPDNLPDMNAEQASDYGKILQGFGNTQLSDVHYFPITQPMRESIKQKGLPLYQQVGIPTAGAGAASQMLEPQEEPEYSKGGSIAKMAALAKLKQMRGEMAPRAEAVKNIIARDENRYLADVVPNSLTNAEIEAEIKRMAARAKASGQQEGVLPLAEREANKAKYLEKSKEKNVMYHGTDEDISEFRPYTFVTPDPKVADQYPGGGEPAGQNIMPVHVRAENPFDYEIPSHIHKLSSIIKDKQLLKDIKDGYWQSIESPDVLEAIQKLGFDSFYSPDMAKNLGVFKPEQIKSAIGNRGTYDINEREINKATGGAIAKMALKAAPAPKAPQIIKPSTLTELKKIVEKEKGGYGARRVERAADEVPNLEKMYTLDALKERFTGDNAKALMTMSPADFEKFATELQGKTSVGPKAAESAKQGEISKYTVPTNEYVKHLERIAMFDSVPYLNLAKEEVGLPLLPYVSGHEGRHRSRALAGKGEKRNLVGVTPTMDLREGLPRRSQEEFIEAMKKELELSGGLVLPQSEPMMGGRPPIILPDVYAKGGSVKPQVKKSVSGKVKMSDNRDAMFMELSNKKLKRK